MKNSKGFVQVLIVILIVLAAIVGAYYFGTLKNPPSTVPVASAQPSSTPIATADPTVGWKIYTNAKYNFSFKYPTNWTENKSFTDDKSAIVDIVSSEKLGNGPEPLQYQIFVFIRDKATVFPNVGKVDPFTNAKVESTNEFANGEIVYKTDQELSQYGMMSYLFTKDGNSFIELSLNPYDANEPFLKQSQYVTAFNQILSTFKFTK